MPSYSITLASFMYFEPVEETLGRLRKYQLAAEISGEPSEIDKQIFKDLIYSFDIKVSGITGNWGKTKEKRKRKLISSNKKTVDNTLLYIKECIDLCRYFEGNQFNICLFADADLEVFDRNHSNLGDLQKFKVSEKLLPILLELARYAQDNGIKLLVEPLNRYNTPYCTTAADAVRLIEMVNHPYLQMMLDTFHMNIEESSFEESIIFSQSHLEHIHLSDSNRKMPGRGHIEFSKIIKSLSEIKYSKYLGFEPIINKQEVDKLHEDQDMIKSWVLKYY